MFNWISPRYWRHRFLVWHLKATEAQLRNAERLWKNAKDLLAKQVLADEVRNIAKRKKRCERKLGLA